MYEHPVPSAPHILQRPSPVYTPRPTRLLPSPPVVHFQCPASPVGCRRLVGQKELTKFGGRVSRLLLIEGGLRSVSAAEEPVGSCTWLKAASRPLVGSRRAPLALLLGGIAFLFGRLVGATCRARARA